MKDQKWIKGLVLQIHFISLQLAVQWLLINLLDAKLSLYTYLPFAQKDKILLMVSMCVK